jgi:hypothetical protein
MVFYRAKTLTINKWHPQNLVANFNTYHFPYLQRVNYLGGHNIPIRDIAEMTYANRDFKWVLPSHKLLPNNFRYLSKNYINYMSIYDYYNLVKLTNEEKNIERWTEYITQKRGEFLGIK